jgi:uncharacterized protein YecE (DUF72 family)
MSTPGTIRIGIGGWVYPPWRGTFYPKGTPQSAELAYASRQLTAIEINGTFYNSGRADSFRKWRDDTPDGFVFSLKGPRFVTHRKELANAGEALDLFFSRGVLELDDKLGPISWQLAPTKQFDPADMAAFLALLPKTADNRKLRHVIEARHRSFAEPEFAELLAEHGVAVAQVDDAKFPAFDAITADFVYLRLRRCVEEEPTGYPPQELDRWAEHARGHAAEGRDVFLYFINGAKVRAPHAAMALIERVASNSGAS